VPGAAQYAAGFRASGGASPVLAGFLGAIPGVGAMYNGQFVKAFAHVLIFVVLIGVADHFDPAGMLVAAWIFYQIFDAVQTAIARREGRPLPDPFGLNDLGQRLGVPAAAPIAAPYVATTQASAPQPGDSTAPPFVNPAPAAEPSPMPDPSSLEFDSWVERQAAEKAMHDAGFPAPGGSTPYQPLPPVPMAPYVGRPEPIGAIVLIAVGMLFLLSTLGVFRFDWIGRGWPLIIILIGAWLLFRRVRATPRIGGGL
jgi:TM2 domain-containing membrane protein YozV